MMLKNKERPSKLEKGYYQDLVKQTQKLLKECGPSNVNSMNL